MAARASGLVDLHSGWIMVYYVCMRLNDQPAHDRISQMAWQDVPVNPQDGQLAQDLRLMLLKQKLHEAFSLIMWWPESIPMPADTACDLTSTQEDLFAAVCSIESYLEDRIPHEVLAAIGHDQPGPFIQRHVPD